jgi:hypothetical protein
MARERLRLLIMKDGEFRISDFGFRISDFGLASPGLLKSLVAE